MLTNYLVTRDFGRGIVRCDGCGRKVAFDGLEGLKLHPCPYCAIPFFVPKRVAQYWLFKPLGAGGYGSVYKAISSTNCRTYAVKLLPREYLDDPETVDSLHFEAEVGMTLGRHPHLVRTIESGFSDGEHYLVNTFVKGERLDHLIQNLGRFPELLAYDLIFQVLEAEMYIYRKGFLYRDLKPENILVDGKGQITLLDYGLCCTVEQAESGANIGEKFEGSPHFLPPERIVGSPEGQYSEIYSIGMLFYNILSSNTFYKPNKGVRRLILQHVKSVRLTSVKYSLTHCHDLTNRVIDHMIAREPDRRFQNFQNLRNALRTACRRIRQGQSRAKQISFQDFASGHFAGAF